MKRKFHKICLLKGGNSKEREISLKSAKCFAKAVEELGYDLQEFDFKGDIFELVSFLKKNNFDCVLNSFHGGSGENGSIPALLNMLEIPYTHSGVLASAMGMNKYVSGVFFADAGIRIPNTRMRKWVDFLDNPEIQPGVRFVIKPVCDGSSNGVYLIEDLAILESLEWDYGENVLIEEYIPGMELSVGVMGDRPLEVTQIDITNGFYDYQHKYSSENTFHKIPAQIPTKIREEALENALKAHNLLECRGISRADFRYNDANGKLYLLEINTHPGMTLFSLVPEQAKYLGISFNELVEWIIEQARCD